MHILMCINRHTNTHICTQTYKERHIQGCTMHVYVILGCVCACVCVHAHVCIHPGNNS